MHLFSSQKIYAKIISFFVSFLFLIESTLLPIVTFFPRTVSAQTATGTIIVNATLDGNPWPLSGTASIILDASTPQGPYSNLSQVVPATAPGVPTGSYTLTYKSGGPPGAAFSSITPSAAQYLSAGGNVTFTFNFITVAPATGTILSRSTKDGASWDSPPFIANVTYPDGHTADVSTDNPIDAPGSPIGAYRINSVTAPVGTVLQSVNGASLPYSFTLFSGWSTTVTFNFASVQPLTGTVIIKTAKDGQSWDSSHFTANNTGPNGSAVADIDTDANGQQTFNGVPVGTYTFTSITPPAGVILKDINGSQLPYGQTLSANGTVIFTINFTTAATSSQPSLSLSAGNAQGTAISFPQGIALTVNVKNADPGKEVRVFCTDPAGQTCADNFLIGTTDANGMFSAPFGTGVLTVSDFQHSYVIYVIINGAISNKVQFNVTSRSILTFPIARTPGTTFADPYKVGDATTLTATLPIYLLQSLFSVNQDITAYQQIQGQTAVVTATTTTFDLKNSGVCDVSTGECKSSGNWTAGQLTCPDGVSGTRQMTEWVTIGGLTSDKIQWYFQCASASQQSVVISRTPATSPTAYFKVGDASTITATIPPSLFVTDQPVKVFRQIGSGSAFVSDSSSTFTLRDNGACNPSTGTCTASGNWSASQFACPAGVTGVQQMTEWVTAGSATSNQIQWYFQCSSATSPSANGGRSAPTPTTAPMVTLTLNRDQERVLPDQQFSFSGTLDSSQVAFPQGTALFMAISNGVAVNHIEIDGRTLSSSDFFASGNSIKVPFSSALYNGSHSFRLVLQNALPVQLDRLVSVWVSAVDSSNTLLLKGRTASITVAHLPTEVIGKGVSLKVPALMDYNGCCWISSTPLVRVRVFQFDEMDVTRGPFFTPNSIPLLPDNIAFTLFPGDATMQRIGLSLKQFSDSLSREFITAQYQYLLGRDPSSEEMSRYLPMFTQWRNPLAALMDVYNRRTDVQQAVLVPRDNSPLPSYDKLLEWAATKGWKEESSLQSFKLQTGFDDGWKLFQELWGKYEPLAIGYPTDDGFPDKFTADAQTNPISAIASLCETSNRNHGHYRQRLEEPIDFEFCWKNDPMLRHAAILWAKDSGWAYNKFVIYNSTLEGTGIPSAPSVVIINPSGPILASMFGPGKYSEYAQEQQWRYPPAQMYYDLISSSEYASFPEPRFRKNIDSVYRLFLGRQANESDIAWVKSKFLGGHGPDDTSGLSYNPYQSWINEQWEPNGLLVASNFDYVSDVEFLKNPRYITDDTYGIRYIPGEIDAVSSRLVELMEKSGNAELYQGDNFKRILSGLYRLYLRRTPSSAEVEEWRAGGKNFGDIEFAINQSPEYGKDPASADAIRNLYRNYLGRDPSDSETALWSGKTISTIANGIGTSAEIKSVAQQHPENAYIFPIKRIKIVHCGFFCSVFGKILTIALVVAASYFIPVTLPIVGTISGTAGAALSTLAVSSVSAGLNLSQIVTGSLSKGFNEAGFNGETFVQDVSIARAMAGQAGGVFSMTNLFENADPTILDGFRTMAQAPQNNPFAESKSQNQQYGFASLFSAALELLSARQFGQSPDAASTRLAQIDVSGHYGGVSSVPMPQKSGQVGQTQLSRNVIAKNLVRGSSGKEVFLLQKILGVTDLTFLPQYQTGYYGPKTEAAVKRFQKRYGLEPVGFVGPKTLALLNLFGK
ncbi:peptidoglycan-binding protein [Patescibacteria group bacterium]|nr:peptidoglycan-binding protein [Patescibacteria group bacterium]